MQKTIEEVDEIADFHEPAWFQMPLRVYDDERKFHFEQLAQVHDIRPLELRVGLSNIFLTMMARNSLRRER